MTLGQKITRPFRKFAASVARLTRWIYYTFKAKYVLPKKRAARKGRRLEVEVITMMYNEAFLAPLFVRHYAPWADKLTVLFSESADDTRRELEAAANECNVKAIDIAPFEFLNGFDDQLKIARINQAVRKSSADFVVCVDADEFVYPWPFDGADPREELAKESGNIVCCNMFQVYRHITETDVDRKKPPLFQRRHGTRNIDFGDPRKQHYVKPCIVRPDCGPRFKLGCHEVMVPCPEWSPTLWRGVHWAKADEFCVLRSLRDRRDRLSKTNRQQGFGEHLFEATEERIRAELKAHENDPQLF
jgi:hypothetical protein